MLLFLSQGEHFKLILLIAHFIVCIIVKNGCSDPRSESLLTVLFLKITMDFNFNHLQVILHNIRIIL